MKNEKNKKFKSYLLVLLIGFCFSTWLIKSGIINEESVLVMLSRINGLSESIKSSDIRSFIHCGLYGYGYAFGLFKSNLFIYIPSLLYLNGLSIINAYKIYIALSIVLSSLTMYLCIKGLTKSNRVGVISSFLYSGTLCHLSMNALGENIGIFVFLPFIILGLYNLIYDNYNKWWVFLIGLVGLIECSIEIFIIIFILILVFALFNIKSLIKDKKRIKYLFINVILAILLSLHYTLPLIEALFQNDLNTNLIFSLSISNYEVLLLTFSSLLFILISLFRLKLKIKENDKLINFCNISIIVAYITFILAIFVSFNIFWPISTLLFLIADSIIIYYLFRKIDIKRITIYTVIIIVLACLPYATILYQYLHNDNIIYSYDSYDIGDGEYLPEFTDISALKIRGESVTSNNEIMHISFVREKKSLKVSYDSNYNKGTYIEVPLLYYFGYVAEDEDGNNLSITTGRNNVIRIYLNDEDDSGSINIYYKETVIQKVSLYISLLTVVGLLIFGGRHLRKINYKELFKKIKSIISKIIIHIKETIKNIPQNFKEMFKKKDIKAEKAKKPKLIHIEFFRFMAIFLVMFNHTSAFSLYSSVEPHTFSYWFYMFLFVLCKVAVPLFYMIAGATLIKKQEELGTIYKKRVLKYFIILIVWSVIYAVYNYFAYGTELSLKEFFTIMYYDDITPAFWYLYSYLAILMGLPLINKMAKNMKMKDFVYLAIMSFIFIGIIPVVQYRIFSGQYTINWNIRSTLFISDPLTFPLMGYFFEYVLSKKYYNWKNVLIGVVLSLICIGATCYIIDFYCSVNDIEFTEEFISSFISIPTYTIYFAGKLFFMKHNVSEKFKKIICYLGSLVFGVFLLENMVRPETNFVYDILQPFIGALPATIIHIIVAYALGILIVSIMKKIPLFKKML